jgi:hypothetical protein
MNVVTKAGVKLAGASASRTRVRAWIRAAANSGNRIATWRSLPVFAVLLVMVSALAGAQEIGIDRSNLSTKSEQDRVRIVTGIRALGAQWFRDGYSNKAPKGVADLVDVVRIAKEQNLKVLINVLPVGEDYDPGTEPTNGGPEFAKRCGWSAGSRKLSLVNMDKFSARFRAQLDAFKAAKLAPDAFEIGNEFDWICFNGDVPDGHEASSAELMTAVRAYAHFLRTAATLIHSPDYFPNAKIITFGLAHGSDKWDKPMHHIANPGRMVAQLQNLDNFNYLNNASYHVDGYGSHIYPSGDSVGQSTSDILHADVAALGTSRPFWITEWGLDSKRFPNKAGETRAQAMADFYSAVEGFHGTTFGPIFYYAYDTQPGGSGLTDPDGALLPDAKAVMNNRGGQQVGR